MEFLHLASLLITIYAVITTAMFFLSYRPFVTGRILHLEKLLMTEEAAVKILLSENQKASAATNKYEQQIRDLTFKIRTLETGKQAIQMGINGRPNDHLLFTENKSIPTNFQARNVTISKNCVLVPWEEIFEGDQKKLKLFKELFKKNLLEEQLKDLTKYADENFLVVPGIEWDEDQDYDFKRNRTHSELVDDLLRKMGSIQQEMHSMLCKAERNRLLEEALK